tara:strand:+ start:161 stop:1390 length:1230 start_codon:yes stop_codon:yes gene_type:complete
MTTQQKTEDDRYRILFEHSSDAHIIFDDTGLMDCNDATIELLRADDRNHVLAMSAAALSPDLQPDGRRSIEKATEMAAIAREFGYHRFEWLHRRLDGEVFPVEVTLNSVEIGGRPAIIAVWHDLTELKRAEAELLYRSSELEAANQILGSLNNRLRQDLQSAAQIQKALLPTVLPDVERVNFAWTFRPCDELAGDILNIYQLDEQHIGFYVLDVSGHGVSAALLSVVVSRLLSPHGPSSLLRWSTDGRLASPSEVLERLNRQFVSEQSDQFFTLFYGVLNLRTFELCYANAGHPGPVIIDEHGAITTLQHSSFPIGIVDETTYKDCLVSLNPGDRLWLYSDGLIEAMNGEGVLYGKDRLDAELQAANTMSVCEGVEYLMKIVEDWAGQSGPQDDISLIALGIDRVRTAS